MSTHGFEEARRALRQAQADIQRKKRKGMGKAVEHIRGESIKEVPLETAELLQSAYSRVNDDGTAEVGYTAKHAVPQHENLQYRHDPGRNAKYLEGPAMREKNTAAQIIADALRED